ncbi:MAG: site-specific integrase [Burkholderia gladioli]
MNWAFAQLLARLDLTDDERRHLASSTPHALRHTFGTQAIAANVPPDVAQKVLGHASLTTTSIYAQAETKRVRRELAGYFAQMQALNAPTAQSSATPMPRPDAPSGQQDVMISTAEWPLNASSPVPNASEQVAHVHVTLQVQASTAQRSRQARDAIERWILAFDDTASVESGVVRLMIV